MVLIFIFAAIPYLASEFAFLMKSAALWFLAIPDRSWSRSVFFEVFDFILIDQQLPKQLHSFQTLAFDEEMYRRLRTSSADSRFLHVEETFLNQAQRLVQILCVRHLFFAAFFRLHCRSSMYLLMIIILTIINITIKLLDTCQDLRRGIASCASSRSDRHSEFVKEDKR